MNFFSNIVKSISGLGIVSYPVFLLADINEGVNNVLSLPEVQGETLKTTVDEGVFSTAQTMIIAVAIIAFLWVSYAAVAKFRECQMGRADWSELLVLGVAGAALLVFIGLTISTAAGFLSE